MGKINLNSYKIDSVVDGPGLRMVIFLQGCMHKCKGCHNKDSWTLENKKVLDVQDLYVKIKQKASTKKITISGGEPFLQDSSLLELCKLLKKDDFNICVYTGYTYEQILREYNKKKVLENIDILVDGKFEIDKLDKTASFVGSFNQRVIYFENGKIKNIIAKKIPNLYK